MKDIVLNIEKKVNSLISSYTSIKIEKQKIFDENEKLRSLISEKDLLIQDLEEKLKMSRITRSVSTHDGDIKASRQKINEYVREIDKCIALLNK